MLYIGQTNESHLDKHARRLTEFGVSSTFVEICESLEENESLVGLFLRSEGFTNAPVIKTANDLVRFRDQVKSGHVALIGYWAMNDMVVEELVFRRGK